MINIQMNEKMRALRELRSVLNSDQYKYAAATIYTNYYIEVLRSRGKKLDKQKILDRVNLMLRSNDIEEVTYNFVRKYDLTI